MNKHNKKKRSHRHGRPGPRNSTPQGSASASASTSDLNVTDGGGSGGGGDDSDSSQQNGSDHRAPTRPYELRVSDEMGRYLVASRDLGPGDVIFDEEPLVMGPCAGTDPACLGCYRLLSTPVPQDQYTCPSCGWPLCGPHCPGLGTTLGHSVDECEVLKDTGSSKLLDLWDDAGLRDQYEAITPLRCLLLQRHRTADWRTIKSMETHDAVRRRANPAGWQHNQCVVVDRIREAWGFKSRYTEADIHSVCGALEVNAFEIGHFGKRARALYPRAFLLAHDCTPNTTHADDPVTRKLTVRTARRLRHGEIITLSYADTLQGTMSRREHILDSKFFSCRCLRCSDPSELSTNLSALRCPRCPLGIVLPLDPLDPESVWTCTATGIAKQVQKGTRLSLSGKTDQIRDSNGAHVNNSKSGPAAVTDKGLVGAGAGAVVGITKEACTQYRVQARSVRMLMERVQDELDSMHCNDVKGLEDFLLRYRNVLHSDHYLRLAAKLRLSQLYGKVTGYLAQHLTREQLLRKQQLCEELMRVFDVLEPGLTRLRGITLYEWHAPIMILATRDFEAKKLRTDELRIRLKQVVSCLRESATILSLEPATSSEGMMAAAAKDALHRIKDWQKIIGKI